MDLTYRVSSEVLANQVYEKLLPSLCVHAQVDIFPIWETGAPIFHSADPCFGVSQDLTLAGLSLCSAFQFVCYWTASMRTCWGSFARLSGLHLVLCGANVVPARFISSGSAPWERSHITSKNTDNTEEKTAALVWCWTFRKWPSWT